MHVVLRILRMVVVLVLLTPSAAWAQFAGAFGSFPSPFELSVARKPDGGVRIDIEIAQGAYLYRDRLTASTGGASVPVSSSPGVPIDDATFGTVEVWRDYAEASLRPEDLPMTGRFEISWQGCRDGGICLPPVVAVFDASTLDRIGSAVGPTTRASPAATPSPDASPSRTGRVAPVLAETAGAGNPSRDGLAAAAGTFLLLGLLLAFTPCVYPMYPVLAATLAGDARAGSRAGFVPSVVFVAAMAGVYAAVGCLAALGGAGVQDVLRSPAAAIASTVVLAVLALSAFGVLDVSLPALPRRCVDRTAAEGPRLLRAASGGAVAAFAAGPCVTAPLAGALLYVAEGGDPAAGAVLLLALGIGKGMPLVVIGTFGGRILPRGGPWLSAVRTASGAVLTAYAVWTLSAVVPQDRLAVYWGSATAAASAVAVAVGLLRGNGKGAVAGAGSVAAATSFVFLLGVPTGSAVPSAGVPGAPVFAGAETADDLARVPGGRPALVYVTADWCRTCGAIDADILSDPSVTTELSGFDLVEVDVTRSGPEVDGMLASLGAVGAPTLVFLDAANREAVGSRIVGSTDVRTVLASLRAARRSPSGS